jgi:hypothetical protein
MRRRCPSPFGPGAMAAVMALLIGCTAAAAPPVSVSNLTEVAIALYVNGTLAETLDPGTASAVPLSGREGLPFSIEARTPSGRAIAWWTITDDQYAAAASGNVGQDSTMGFPCGTIRLTVGTPVEPQPPAADDLAPGPCP